MMGYPKPGQHSFGKGGEQAKIPTARAPDRFKACSIIGGYHYLTISIIGLVSSFLVNGRPPALQ